MMVSMGNKAAERQAEPMRSKLILFNWNSVLPCFLFSVLLDQSHLQEPLRPVERYLRSKEKSLLVFL